MNNLSVRKQYEFTTSKLRLNRRCDGRSKWFMPSGTIPKNWCADNGIDFKVYLAVLKQMRNR